MLELIEVSKRYGAMVLADRLSLTMAPGEILALLGPSGSGKSTLLKIIAGLEPADGGQLRFAGEDLAAVPPEARGFALIFQDYALFPHLDVLANVCFGLIERKLARPAARERARDALAAVGLAGFERRRIDTLSGGEAQRVALARALVTGPRLLLLDEPFSSLDARLRLMLQQDFRSELRARGISAIWVTHDRQEAFAMADRVALLDGGRIVQCAAPADLVRAPVSPWVARFIGYDNVDAERVVPDAALLPGPGDNARIEAVWPRPEGVGLRVALDGAHYVVNLSAREAAAFAGRLVPGAAFGLTVDPGALIRFV